MKNFYKTLKLPLKPKGNPQQRVRKKGQFIYCPFIVGVSDVKKDDKKKKIRRRGKCLNEKLQQTKKTLFLNFSLLFTLW